MIAWVVTAGICVTFLTAVANLMSSLHNRRRIAEVHVLVNSQLEEVVARVGQLTHALEDANIAVPEP